VARAWEAQRWKDEVGRCGSLRLYGQLHPTLSFARYQDATYDSVAVKLRARLRCSQYPVAGSIAHMDHKFGAWVPRAERAAARAAATAAAALAAATTETAADGEGDGESGDDSAEGEGEEATLEEGDEGGDESKRGGRARPLLQPLRRQRRP
jgi:hypothetical protein